MRNLQEKVKKAIKGFGPIVKPQMSVIVFDQHIVPFFNDPRRILFNGPIFKSFLKIGFPCFDYFF